MRRHGSWLTEWLSESFLSTDQYIFLGLVFTGSSKHVPVLISWKVIWFLITQIYCKLWGKSPYSRLGQPPIICFHDKQVRGNTMKLLSQSEDCIWYAKRRDTKWPHIIIFFLKTQSHPWKIINIGKIYHNTRVCFALGIIIHDNPLCHYILVYVIN